MSLLPVHLLLVVTLVALVVAAPRDQEIDCEDPTGRIDKCGKDLMYYGDREHSAPENLEQLLKKHCPFQKRSETCIRQYARKCLKPFPKQIIGLIIYGASKQIKKRCNTEDGQQEYLRKTVCSRGPAIEPQHKCMDVYVSELEAIRDSVSNLDLKLPYTCCYFYRFRNCMENYTKTICNQEEVDYTLSMIDATSDDALDLTCKGYERDGPNCDKLAPLVDVKPKVALSVIPPLVDIYTSL